MIKKKAGLEKKKMYDKKPKLRLAKGIQVY
jgi:hypothetical protein